MLTSLVFCAFVVQRVIFAGAEPQVLRRSSMSNSTSSAISILSTSSYTSLSSTFSSTSISSASTASLLESSVSLSTGSSGLSSSTASSGSSSPSESSSASSSSISDLPTTVSSSSTSSSSTSSSSKTSSSTTTFSSAITSSSASLTESSTNSSTISRTSLDSPVCTGCVLQADYLLTLTYPDAPLSVGSYLAGTVTTVESTGTDDLVTTILLTNFDPGAAPTLPANQTDVHLTLTWTWSEAPDVTLTAPSTYIAYYDIAGGLDAGVPTAPPEPTETEFIPLKRHKKEEEPEETCTQNIQAFNLFPPAQGQPFIYPVADVSNEGVPVSLPPPLVAYLAQVPAIMSAFNGSDIATCTLETTITSIPLPGSTLPPLYSTNTNAFLTIGEPSPTSTKTLVTPTFVTAPSVIHISASNIRSKPNEETGPALAPPVLKPSGDPKISGPVVSFENHVSVNPGNHKPASTPGIGDIIASIIHNNPSIFNNPPPKTQGNPPPGHTEGVNRPLITPPVNSPPQSVAVGNTVVPVAIVPISGGGVVVGGQTLTPGQVTTLNGVIVSVPPGGSSVVVGGSTIAVNPANPTSPPVLTVGGTVITANPSGQFILGTQTLQPGGPVLTVDGTTFSLGPSGTVAVVNGVTQTLNTPHPALTIGGTVVTANPSGEFVIGMHTLKPGGPILTIDGTTFSLGPSGTVAVVNGVTQTLNGTPLITAPPVLVVDGHTVSATVVDGTTQFVLAPGQTLTPGGVLTVSGTTFSLPAGATPGVVVINGVTSTLNNAIITAAPLLTLNGQIVSATVVDGTTQYVLGPGTTLIPGGPAVTVSGTTYTLPAGASNLVINGHTSTIAPASVSATTTADSKVSSTGSRSGSIKTSTSSGSRSSKSSSQSSSSTSSLRAPGNFIASGIGISSKPSQAPASRAFGFEAMVEAVLMGAAGWALVLL